jgi:hypothetical protein
MLVQNLLNDIYGPYKSQQFLLMLQHNSIIQYFDTLIDTILPIS